jgi:phosphate transport system protein
LAAALDDMDDHLDQIHKDYIEAIFEAHHDGGLAIDVAVQLALIGRYYERIGDHAVNIGTRVEYMVTGWLPEHSGAARHQARVALHDREPDGGPPFPEVLAGANGEAADAPDRLEG